LIISDNSRITGEKKLSTPLSGTAADIFRFAEQDGQVNSAGMVRLQIAEC
jgi:hypothetical protein